MSRVAHEFWNHKRIGQAEARQRLKALGILVDPPRQVETFTDLMERKYKEAEEATKQYLTKELWMPGTPIKKGRAVGPSA